VRRLGPIERASAVLLRVSVAPANANQ